jgi:predicted Zn finger-like uncharacterized protein
MANIRVTCPTCQTELEIDEVYVGQEVECGNCLQVFVARRDTAAVPAAADERPAAGSRRGSAAERDRPSRRRDDEYEEDDRPARRSRRRDDDDYEFDRPSRRHREPPKSRVAYILLGIFLGELGVHNFYAGHTNAAVWQLVITLVSIPLMCVFVGFLTIFIPMIWAIVDVCTIDRDADGRLME